MLFLYQLFLFSDGRKSKKVQCCQLESYYETRFEAKFNFIPDLIRNAVNVTHVCSGAGYLKPPAAVNSRAGHEMFPIPYSQCLQSCPAKDVQPAQSWMLNAFLELAAGSSRCLQDRNPDAGKREPQHSCMSWGACSHQVPFMQNSFLLIPFATPL